MIRVLLSVLLVLIIQPSAVYADDQRAATIQKLYELSQDVLTQTTKPFLQRS